MPYSISLGMLTQFAIVSLLVVSCSKRPAPSSYDIKFGKEVGPLNFNMTKDQIQNVLGSPSFQRDKVLNYNELGLTVFLNRKGTIGSIICGSIEGDTNLMSNFKGTSKDDITLGTLLEDVVRVYGQPTEIRNGGELYRYENLSADFAFKDNRVVCIVVRPMSAAQMSGELKSDQ